MMLVKTDLAGLKGKEGLMWVAEIPQGGRTGKHYHFVVVLITEKGQPPAVSEK